ncbi:hypothetical protein Lal_00008330 [Lupinus albus]|uniref:Probable purine permease n=1 Tax=Lupinus albus TaxID=3870 RepID=A0A6A5M1Q4_LUPAL|nr:putative purine permease, plant [Lupinus albus]KAF1868521.1 hypothetical protein Lal_00008330 [Lupinus albus]
MAESPQEVQLSLKAANEVKENSMEDNFVENEIYETRSNYQKRKWHWLLVAIYVVFALLGQSIATLLGKLYYENGGNSKWMGAFVQFIGFPIVVPCYYISSLKSTTRNNLNIKQPSTSTSMVALLMYITLGLLAALECYFFSLGLWYLPVSTYAIISSSQLAFNAFFSFFLNSMKFSPYIINSLVLLTISSTLLIFQTEAENEHSIERSKKKQVIGFICTIIASAGEGLLLSLTQFAFEKVLKRESFHVIMDVIIYQSIVATCVTFVGLFASGEWNGLRNEMNTYELGKTCYVLNLVFIAITWQLYSIGSVGLIFEVSSLFADSLSVLAEPIVPILAVIFFHETMNGIKAISMVLSIWGFTSYIYHHYLDKTNAKH